MNFKWDDDKAIANWRKHDVEFNDATQVFWDENRVETFDGRELYGEDRFACMGLFDGNVLVVIYTLREENIRLISARKAESYERRIYWENCEGQF